VPNTARHGVGATPTGLGDADREEGRPPPGWVHDADGAAEMLAIG
jgi:hypothetical protein